VALNATVTNPSTASWLSIFPTASPNPVPNVSNLNFTGGQTVPNRVVVKLGLNGQISINNALGYTDVMIDVNGWFTSSSSTKGGSHLVPVTPSRLVDTRGYGGLGPNQTATLDFYGVEDETPSAVVINVTATNPSQSSWLTVWPGGQLPNTSDLNFVPGQTVPNLVVVQVGGTLISIHNQYGTTDVIVDLVGYFGLPTPPQ
jgi:hypothetical protein